MVAADRFLMDRYNSYTGVSEWDPPSSILTLLRSQGIGAPDGAGGGGGVGGGGGAPFTQLRVEIERLEFTSPVRSPTIANTASIRMRF